MSIWFRSFTLDEVRGFTGRDLAQHLGIEIIELGEDFVRGTMPVDHRTRQGLGILHGGASAALAETLASIGANLCVDRAIFQAVGQELNANHIRPVTSGVVVGTASPLHRGKRSHVWDIRIEDEQQRLVCVSRLTLAIVARAPANS